MNQLWLDDNWICEHGWDHTRRKYQVKKWERAKNIRGMLTFCSLKEDENANGIERRGKEKEGKQGGKGKESINHYGITGDNKQVMILLFYK